MSFSSTSAVGLRHQISMDLMLLRSRASSHTDPAKAGREPFLFRVTLYISGPRDAKGKG